MLQQLSIKNYALIDDVNISFKSGFTVITGETGAGKSIMLDALGLLMGNRADAKALKNGDKKCVVEGVFRLDQYDLKTFFEEEELEFEAESIIRREIAGNGKSRAFVNDSPVMLHQLKKLGEKLLDVHSQNASLVLADELFYYDLLDGFAGKMQDRIQYQIKYQSYKVESKKLQDKINSKADKESVLDFKQFQLNELNAANLQEGELESLEEELSVLGHADDILSKLGSAVALLGEGELPINSSLLAVQQLLVALEKRGSVFADLSNRIKSVAIEVEDIYSELQTLASKVEADPNRLSFVEERIGSLYSLQKKYKVNSIVELIAIRMQLENEVDEVLGGSEEIEKLKAHVQKLKTELESVAKNLSSGRKKAGKELAIAVQEDLSAMKMENAKLEVQVIPAELNAFGMDEIQFLFSANAGGSLQPLSKVASGGEFSRIMLSLKRILSAQKSLPTILFDEIDTGVSGEVADKMSAIMKGMSKDMQVISITHLPQIAAKGHQHLKVFKETTAGTTSSKISVLSQEERVLELAQMLSGSKVTDAAVANARELLA